MPCSRTGETSGSETARPPACGVHVQRRHGSAGETRSNLTVPSSCLSNLELGDVGSGWAAWTSSRASRAATFTCSAATAMGDSRLPVPIVTDGTPIFALKLGDLDSDGILDILYTSTGSPRGVAWQKGVGDGTFLVRAADAHDPHGLLPGSGPGWGRLPGHRRDQRQQRWRPRASRCLR